LRIIEQAVWQDRKLLITYIPLFTTKMRRTINPLGLVAKAGVWYLVGEHKKRIRVYRVDELQEVKLMHESFQRPHDFDLAIYWNSWCEYQKNWHSGYVVTIRVAARFIPELPTHFGNYIKEKIKNADPPDNQDRIALTVSFDSLADARSRLLSFGNAVEVLQPLALRLSIGDYARQVEEMYSGSWSH
jgi:predicted DNA-binding transcriptional regulator YafY